MRHVTLLWLAAAACGDTKLREPGPTEPHEEPITVAWSGTASVYDVLGRQTSAAPRLVQVPLRQLPTGLTLHPADPSEPTLRRVTSCAPGFCADGIVADRRLVSGALPACGMWTDESTVASVHHPDGVCHFVRRPALTAEEAEVLDGEGSWIERGIQVRNASGTWVSFLEATAWFTADAAHSHASLACRTYGPSGPATLDSGLFPPHEVTAITEALDAFFVEQREAVDDRMRGLVTDRATLAGAILVDSPRSLVVCAGADPNDGVVQLVRVTLPATTI